MAMTNIDLTKSYAPRPTGTVKAPLAKIDERVAPPAEAELRQRSVKHLQKRRDFAQHVLVYAMVNAFIVLIWVVTPARGFFWPAFWMAGWAAALVLQGWNLRNADGPREGAITREMHRLQPGA